MKYLRASVITLSLIGILYVEVDYLNLRADRMVVPPANSADATLSQKSSNNEEEDFKPITQSDHKSESLQSSIAARPLFLETRKPWEAPKRPIIVSMGPASETTQTETSSELPIPDKEDIPLPVFLFLGTKTLDGVQSALISTEGETPLWVERGAYFMSWRLEDILDHSVILTNGSLEAVVSLY